MTSEHITALYPHISGPENDYLWDYMLSGPFNNIDEYRATMEAQLNSPDMVLYAIIPADKPVNPDDNTPNVVGCASYMNIEVNNRSIEVGSIMFSRQLQKTPAATEAMYLMARHAFDDLGYRRYEWKCDDLNASSKIAAWRLGFSCEGMFRQHMIVKKRSRDTVWFAILDYDWEVVKGGLAKWLRPSNFNEDGTQRSSLLDCRNSVADTRSRDGLS